MKWLRAPTIPARAAVGLPDSFLRHRPDHFHLHLLTYTHTHTHTAPARQFVTCAVSALPKPLQAVRAPVAGPAVLFKFPPLPSDPSVTAGVEGQNLRSCAPPSFWSIAEKKWEADRPLFVHEVKC